MLQRHYFNVNLTVIVFFKQFNGSERKSENLKDFSAVKKIS